jgi:hypothetical protein
MLRRDDYRDDREVLRRIDCRLYCCMLQQHPSKYRMPVSSPRVGINIIDEACGIATWHGILPYPGYEDSYSQDVV